MDRKARSAPSLQTLYCPFAQNASLRNHISKTSRAYIIPPSIHAILQGQSKPQENHSCHVTRLFITFAVWSCR